jgi:hypothetical protein
MSFMGVHFAVSDSDFIALRSCRGDAEKIAFLDEVIEPAYEQNFGTDYDKAWPLIHSALQMSNPCSDYLERTTRGPASWAVLGEEDLAMTDEAMITHVGPSRAMRVLEHLQALSADDIRSNLIRLIKDHGCAKLSEDDANYAADWYPRLQDFYSKATGAQRHVIFSADFS